MRRGAFHDLTGPNNRYLMLLFWHTILYLFNEHVLISNKKEMIREKYTYMFFLFFQVINTVSEGAI